ETVELTHLGLNHLSWETAVHVNGVNRLPDLIETHSAAIAQRVKLPEDLVRQIGLVPSYYLRYYYTHDAALELQRSTPSRASEVQAIERELLAIYADSAADTKPEALSRRGGALYSEAAVQLMASLVGSRPGRHVVNV